MTTWDNPHNFSKEIVISIARVAHEANRSLSESYGDTSQSPWYQAPDWMQESTVTNTLLALRIQADPQKSGDPDAVGRAIHDAWMLDRLNNGWSYGPEKDTAKKKTPYLVDYDELPLRVKQKDWLFAEVVEVMTHSLLKTR